MGKVERIQSQIDLKGLKQFALNRLPKENPLRDILLTEQDQLDTRDFLVKSEIWLKLAGR